jgi:hypothetical protein
MNKYLHYCAPMIIGTLFGFILGYGIRCKEVKQLKDANSKLNDYNLELYSHNLELVDALEKICKSD